MPRTKLGQKIRTPDPLVALIWGEAGANDIALTDIAEAAHMSLETLRRRKINPEDLTLKDLRRIGRFMHISIEELRKAITY